MFVPESPWFGFLPALVQVVLQWADGPSDGPGSSPAVSCSGSPSGQCLSELLHGLVLHSLTNHISFCLSKWPFVASSVKVTGSLPPASQQRPCLPSSPDLTPFG